MVSYKRKEVPLMEKKRDPLSIVPPLMRSNFYPPIADPMGSYTGIPEDPFETPVQDADDL